jgi:hypothetical protein
MGGIVHLVADPEKLKIAVERGLPFYRSACGRIVPIGELTDDVNAVRCLACKAIISAHLESSPPPAPPPSVAVEPEGAIDEDGLMVVEFDDDEDLAIPPVDSHDEQEESEDAGSDMLAMAREMLAPYLDVVETTEGYEAILEQTDETLEVLSREESDLICMLHQLTSMGDMSDLVDPMLSILYRLIQNIRSQRTLLAQPDDVGEE